MTKKREFKYGVFDRDGVLIDSHAIYKALFFSVARKMGLHSLAREEIYTKALGKNWMDLPLILRADLPAAEQALLPEFIRQYDAASSNAHHESAIFEAVPRVLTILKNAGLRLFVSSMGYQERVELSLRRHSIDHYFELALGVPAPMSPIDKADHLAAIADFLRIPLADFAQSAFFLGDSVGDMQVARRHNLFAIGLTTSESSAVLKAAGADTVINRHEDLLNIVAS